MIKCNICWEGLDKEAFLALSCSHVFCLKDAQQHFSSESVCPVCDTRLRSRNGLVKLNLEVHAEKTIALCGLPPKKILEIATKAIEFYNYQKNTELQYHSQEYQNLKEECDKAESEKTRQLVDYQTKLRKTQKMLEKERRESSKMKEELTKVRNTTPASGSEYDAFDMESLPKTRIRPLTDNPSKRKRNKGRTPSFLEHDKLVPTIAKSPSVSTMERFAMVRKKPEDSPSWLTTRTSLKTLFTPRFFQSTPQKDNVTTPVQIGFGNSNFLLQKNK